jgi:hypothetical protein
VRVAPSHYDRRAVGQPRRGEAFPGRDLAEMSVKGDLELLVPPAVAGEELRARAVTRVGSVNIEAQPTDASDGRRPLGARAEGPALVVAPVAAEDLNRSVGRRAVALRVEAQLRAGCRVNHHPCARLRERSPRLRGRWRDWRTSRGCFVRRGRPTGLVDPDGVLVRAGDESCCECEGNDSGYNVVDHGFASPVLLRIVVRPGAFVQYVHGVAWRPRIHAALVVLGGLYLMGAWLEGVGSTLPSKLLPRTPLYFLQIAALFPHAAVASIDYRAEGWVCREHKWRELITRPYFPLDPDDKENRFQRVMHFFRDHRATMHALDDYLVSHHNEGGHDDGVAEDAKLGGIRTLSLRLPLPSPGDPLVRLERKPLASYPDSVRKSFYHSTRASRTERCGYAPTPDHEPHDPHDPHDEGPE